MKKLIFILIVAVVAFSSCQKPEAKEFTITYEGGDRWFDIATTIYLNGEVIRKADPPVHVDVNGHISVSELIEEGSTITVHCVLNNLGNSWDYMVNMNKTSWIPYVYFIYNGEPLVCKKDPHYGSTSRFRLYRNNKAVEEFVFTLN